MGSKSLAAILVLGIGAGAIGQESEHVLVWYDFDGSEIETGPYTVSVFEDARGSVSMTSTYRMSGHHSVEIRDVAGDGEFAELQGYFPDKNTGKLYFHFAFLIAEPLEPMNIALAGISHFYLRKDGIGFWLKTKDGILYQVTAGREETLFFVEAFTWYVTDVTYDLDRGTYDMTIEQEGVESPLIAVRDQPNAVGIPGSRLRKFSFIGDPPGEDSSNAWFYVDDIIIAADSPIPQNPFIAPGRRMLFVDLYDYWQTRLYKEPGCSPALDHKDFGFSNTDLRALARLGYLEYFDELAARQGPTRRLPDDLPEYIARLLDGMVLWARGCAAPKDCGSEPCATELFARARRISPQAKLYPMSTVLALASQKRWKEADALFLAIYWDWYDDPRFPALSAVLGIARGDLQQAESWLQTSVDSLPPHFTHPLIRKLWSGEPNPALVRDLQSEFPSEWSDYVEAALTSEHKFYVLLWQKRFEEARGYAVAMVERFREMELPTGKWLEKAGDASFYIGDFLGALQRYERSLEGSTDPDPIFLKLSDVHFKLGNLDQERYYREKSYGRLERK